MNALPWVLWAITLPTNVVLFVVLYRQAALLRRTIAIASKAVADGKRAADACDEAIEVANRYREQLFRREGRSN